MYDFFFVPLTDVDRTCKISDLPSGPLKSILCGDLLCGINTCMRWNSDTYKFEKTSVNLQKRRDNHLCWAIDNGVLLLGGKSKCWMLD